MTLASDQPLAAADGRRLLRLEARNAAVPIEHKPPWIRTRLRTGPEYQALLRLIGTLVTGIDLP